MKTIFHPEGSRGFTDLGSLRSYHTFSFGDYENRTRMHFGALRVLNVDYLDGGAGFDIDPQNDMEIVTLPLEGAFIHLDSMGNEERIRRGEVQLVSACAGIRQSIANAHPQFTARLLQLWIFPGKTDIEFRYQKYDFREGEKHNNLTLLVCPDNLENTGKEVQIHQDAWISLGVFDEGQSCEYHMKRKSNCAYLFVTDGEIRVENQTLHEDDGLGIWDTGTFRITATTESRFVLMDLPVALPLRN